MNCDFLKIHKEFCSTLRNNPNWCNWKAGGSLLQEIEGIRQIKSWHTVAWVEQNLDFCCCQWAIHNLIYAYSRSMYHSIQLCYMCENQKHTIYRHWIKSVNNIFDKYTIWTVLLFTETQSDWIKFIYFVWRK